MPLIQRAILTFFALILLTACEKGATLSKLGPHDVILAFGDSLTFGTGASPQTAYPAQLAERIGRPVVNAGVPGETTTDALERLPQVLTQYRPKLVLLCLGGNDMLRQQATSNIEHNLRALIKTIQDSNAAVVLIGVPEPRLFGGSPGFYAEIANELKLPYEGEVFNEVLKNPNLKSDPIHANDQGYQRVAQRLADLLKSSGAL